MLACQVCQEEAKNTAALHRHVKKEHKLVPREYYPLFFDRRDKLTDDRLEFTDVKTYFNCDFALKSHLLEWFERGTDEAKDYGLNLLINRCREKGTAAIPSHVELKSLFTPSIKDYLSVFGGADSLRASLAAHGLNLKLEPTSSDFVSGDIKIYVDTREQTPLSFSGPTQVKKLIVGDYCPDDSFFCNLFVERKSMHDLAGTLTKGIERFQREIERAAELDAYLVVVTEFPYADALEYSPRNSFSQRIGGAFLFNKVRRLMTEYSNVQFLFAPNRQRSSEIIENIFRMGEKAKTSDLEFLKDNRLI